MKPSVFLLSLFALCYPLTANAADAGVVSDASAKADAVVPASQPTPAPSDVKPAGTTDEAVQQGKDFVGALKAKKWWFASALGIYVLMFALGMFGVWTKMGTTWAWITVGVLSLAAGIFLAFDKGGFSWSSFLTYMTAGPTIAWLRDFVKDGILKKAPSGAKK